VKTEFRSDNVNASWNNYYIQDKEKQKNGLIGLLDLIFGKKPDHLSVSLRDFITPDINAHLLNVFKQKCIEIQLEKSVSISFLELGCGQAKLSLKLADLNRKNHFTMVDFSDELKNEIEKTICLDNLNAKLIIEDILTYIPGKKYEFVYGGAILCHLPEDKIGDAFKKFVQYCKKGGFVINAEPIPSRELDILTKTPGIPEEFIKGKPIAIQNLIDMHKKNGLEIIHIGKACIFQRLHLLSHINAKQVMYILPHLILYIPNKLLELPCSYFMKRQRNKISKILYLSLKPMYQLSSYLCLKFSSYHGSHLIVVSRKK